MNVGRGGLINERDLLDALNAGQVRAYLQLNSNQAKLTMRLAFALALGWTIFSIIVRYFSFYYRYGKYFSYSGIKKNLELKTIDAKF